MEMASPVKKVGAWVGGWARRGAVDLETSPVAASCVVLFSGRPVSACMCAYLCASGVQVAVSVGVYDSVCV